MPFGRAVDGDNPTGHPDRHEALGFYALSGRAVDGDQRREVIPEGHLVSMPFGSAVMVTP